MLQAQQPSHPPSTLRNAYLCQICKKTFTTSGGLRQHDALLHRGFYRYKCQYCGKGFSATSNLKGHLVSHTGSKEYVCSLCQEAFSYGYLLKRHMSKFHPTHPWCWCFGQLRCCPTDVQQVWTVPCHIDTWYDCNAKLENICSSCIFRQNGPSCGCEMYACVVGICGWRSRQLFPLCYLSCS